jgi:translocation and assembly module TamB
MEEQVPQGLALQALALRLNGSLWQLQAPTGVRWGEIAGVEVDSLVLRRTFTGTERQAQRAGAVVEEGWIEMDGRLPPTGALDFRVRATNVDVGELRQLVPNAPQIEGVLTLEASLEGPSAAPELFLDARIANLRFRDIDVEALAVSARYADGGATADAALWQNGVQVGNAQATIPMQLAFENLLPQIELLDAQPVSARVVADSIPFGLLAAAIPGAVQGTGVVAGELTVGGPLGTPDLQGWATVAGGGITLTELGVRYEEIDARVAMQGQSIQVESLTARSGGGVALSGVIQVDDRTRPQLDLSASFNQFRAIDRANVASIAISGPVTLTGRFPTPVLSGRVELSSGTITLPAIEDRDVFEITDVDVGEIGEGALPAEALEPTLVEQIRISGLEITIGDGVWAVSPEARVQLGGELVVSRLSPVEWQVFGDLLARRGSYTLSIGPLVREFDVVSGRIEFFGTPDLNPSLDILAQHRIRTASAGAGGSPTLNILVQITGSVQFPRIQLTSDTQPPLPESELLSYLIFGRPTFALGEVGGGLAQQLILQELAGGVVATQVEQLIQQAGLPFDYVRVRGRPTPTGFGPTALGATTIELGWQIAPEVFWTVEWGVGRLFGGDLGDTWGASLEWQIDPQWSVRGAWEPLRRDLLLQPLSTNLTRQFSLDLRRRWEYGFTPAEPRVPLATEEAQPSSAPAPAVPPEREPDR